MSPYPEWLHFVSWIGLSLAFICFLIIAADEIRRPQKMMVMNFVWPVTALYFGPLALWAYFRVATESTRQAEAVMRHGHSGETSREIERLESHPATPTQIAVGVSHCGAGCTLGDILAEWGIFLFGMNIVGEFGTKLLLDLLAAWSLGIVYQYFTIVPMRGLSAGQGIRAAIKADTISILAFEVGLFSWMALSYYVFFPAPHLRTNEAVTWFMMQIGMIIGFITAYPATKWLLNKGWKEKMPETPRAAHRLERVA